MKNNPPVILSIDDDATFVALLRHGLASKGYVWLEASSAEEAWVILESASVDAVLCDVSLPGIDGLECCRKLRASATHAELPIILLSGREDTNFFRLARQAGATDALAKPGTFDQLLSLVGGTLERVLASGHSPGK